MILKVVSEASYGSNLVHMNAGSAGRLAHHDLHITEQVSNRVMPPYLFITNIPDQASRNSSRPNAILVTPCPTNPNRPSWVVTTHYPLTLGTPQHERKERKRKDYASQVQLRASRRSPLTSKLARPSPRPSCKWM
eukprot:1145415-Pelagomonas_calceolata.AAC.5